MEAARTQRPRVVLISHAYIPGEVQKNLSYLAKSVNLRAIVHRWHPDLRTGAGNLIYGRTCTEDSSTIEWVRPFYVRGQSLLFPFGRVLRFHDPHIIYVEYAPWSPLTMETLVLARLSVPKARIVLFDKKNTYIARSFIPDQAKLYLRRIIDKRVSAYILTSEMTKDMYRDVLGMRPEKLYVCNHLGVDLNLFSPTARQTQKDTVEAVIGYCGKMHPRKGVLELVEAVRGLVSEKGLRLQLRLLGDGPLRDTLAKQAASGSWLRVKGAVPHGDVAAFLQGCDMFAFPSRNEPDHQEHDAHALMEAMAVGLPSIATKSGIITELSDTQATFFVQEHSPRQIAERIETLVRYPEVRRSMGSRARGIAERDFGLATLAQKKADILREVWNGRAVP